MLLGCVVQAAKEECNLVLLSDVAVHADGKKTEAENLIKMIQHNLTESEKKGNRIEHFNTHAKVKCIICSLLNPRLCVHFSHLLYRYVIADAGRDGERAQSNRQHYRCHKTS